LPAPPMAMGKPSRKRPDSTGHWPRMTTHDHTGHPCTHGGMPGRCWPEASTGCCPDSRLRTPDSELRTPDPRSPDTSAIGHRA
jgi:hypothetical protein